MSPHGSPVDTTVIAVVGKGGAGKTVVSALIAKSLLDAGRQPLLLVDADPAGGLAYATGVSMDHTIGRVREHLINEASDPVADRDALTNSIDWLVLETLKERGDFSLLAMGRTDVKGCFCPVNKLLREAIQRLAGGFRYVIIDAEAGIEQVNRRVIERVDIPVVVTDGSARGKTSAALLVELLEKHREPGADEPGLLLNRTSEPPGSVPDGSVFRGAVPEDETVRRFDAEGRPLLDLPPENPALQAVNAILKNWIPGL